MKRYIIIITGLVALTALAPYFSFAQFGTTTIDGINIEDIINKINNPLTGLELILENKILSPGAVVRFSVNTYSTDLQKVTFTWLHNGKQILSGKGEVSATITLGPPGIADTTAVVAMTDDGNKMVLQKRVLTRNPPMPSLFTHKSLKPFSLAG